MKHILHCNECMIESLKHKSEVVDYMLNDDGIYNFKCSKGHDNLILVQEQKFEILFESASMAIVDGYPREAVSSLAACLERFYEFYVQTIVVKNEIDPSLFKKNWKHVENQSERQFGAYIASYMIENKGKLAPVIDDLKPEIEDVPKTQTRTWKAFRNAVIHKGYIPSIDETLAYGELVYQHIIALILDLKENSSEALIRSSSLNEIAVREKFQGKHVMGCSSPSPLTVTQDKSWHPDSFFEAIEHVASKLQYRNFTLYQGD